MGTNGPPCRETHQADTNQSGDIMQQSQNRSAGDRWVKLSNTTMKILRENLTSSSKRQLGNFIFLGYLLLVLIKIVKSAMKTFVK